MKKILITGLTAIILVTGLAFNQQIIQGFSSEKPIQKEINFTIGADNNYTSKAYESSYASVKVTVTKISGKKETIIWSKSFDTMPLKKYADFKNALSSKIIIPGVLDRKEKLLVIYTITYNTKGSILQTAYGAEISKGQKNDNLFINI